MKYIYVLEDDERIKKDLFDTLQIIDSKLAIRFFDTLAQFHEWLKLALAEGPMALAKGGSKHPDDKAEAVGPSDKDQLRLVITKNEFLGVKNVNLIERAFEFFLRKKICSIEEPTALILTVFDSHDFDIRMAEKKTITNVLFKPFDKLILKQHLEFALAGNQAVKASEVAEIKIKSTIEMLKEIYCPPVISEIGFTTKNNKEIKIGAFSKYYSDFFKTDNTRSVYAYCSACKFIAEKEYICDFRYFALDNKQIAQIRRNILQVKKHDSIELKNELKIQEVPPVVAATEMSQTPPAAPAATADSAVAIQPAIKSENSPPPIAATPAESAEKPEVEKPKADSATADEKAPEQSAAESSTEAAPPVDGETSPAEETPAPTRPEKPKADESRVRIVLLNEELAEIEEFKHYLEQKMLNLDIYLYNSLGQLLADLADKDTVHKQNLPARIDIFFSTVEFFEADKEKSWEHVIEAHKATAEAHGLVINETPHLYLMAKKPIPPESLRDYTPWATDIFFNPLDKNYFIKKLISKHPAMLNKESTTISSLEDSNKMKVANQVEITQISEAGLVMKYYRPISISAFREFILWRPQETQNPEIPGTVNFSEPEKGNADVHLNYFVFFGMRDYYLKAIRLWLRESYIKTKEEN